MPFSRNKNLTSRLLCIYLDCISKIFALENNAHILSAEYQLKHAARSFCAATGKAFRPCNFFLHTDGKVVHIGWRACVWVMKAPLLCGKRKSRDTAAGQQSDVSRLLRFHDHNIPESNSRIAHRVKVPEHYVVAECRGGVIYMQCKILVIGVCFYSIKP